MDWFLYDRDLPHKDHFVGLAFEGLDLLKSYQVLNENKND